MSEARKQFLHDIFVTALEGGIQYWADIDIYRWSGGKGEPDLAQIVEEETGTAFVVSADTIRKGIQRIMLSDVKYVSEDVKDTVIRANRVNDATDIDAGIADTIVQVGLFEEVVYA